MKQAYRLLIGSIGDDIHSVGISLLSIAFQEAGFLVKNLKIGNSLDDFFHHAHNFDAVFISCMNGHADLYFHSFPHKMAIFNLSNGMPKIWYLGGNLSINQDDHTLIKKYLTMGFDFVAPKPVPWEKILSRLLEDFARKNIKKKDIDENLLNDSIDITSLETVNDNELSDHEFSLLRKKVLASWPTGDQVWDSDIARNHRDISKNLNNLILRHRHFSAPRPLLQPRTGVAHTQDEISILKFLSNRGLDVSSVQLDAASRKNMYHKAKEGVFLTPKEGTSFLNGYPIPIHGVAGVKKIIRAIATPFQLRGGSPDHRLSYEIALAGGASAVEGGFICYLYPYDKFTSPAKSLKHWKYIDKIASCYQKNFGIIINREFFGPLTTTLIEPAIPIVINIVQSLLSAKWGIKSVSVGLAEQGNRHQDVAAIWCLAEMTSQYLKKYGFYDCIVSTVFHHYMAAFPTEIKKAKELIFQSSITAALSKPDRIMVKTPVEAHHIPSKEDNAEALSITLNGLRNAKNYALDQNLLRQEMSLLKKEVTTLMNCIELLGENSLARGIMRAFQQGILDIPFSPSIYNKNNLITARDCDGAVRFINPETLPFENDIIDFHKEKIHQRMTRERLRKHTVMIEKDLTRIWSNDFKQWPLDGSYID